MRQTIAYEPPSLMIQIGVTGDAMRGSWCTVRQLGRTERQGEEGLRAEGPHCASYQGPEICVVTPLTSLTFTQPPRDRGTLGSVASKEDALTG
ncbi:hypothetical protein E2C01_004006 [Portunus trituberculatus]|uniref:Uncharacterized protein n=1 Tax=Portunus trituberculatus TaxID=210409 RepID=A0A5B7CV75_PORTR|nr:hypothetical protein [Portunus trituberculatus]